MTDALYRIDPSSVCSLSAKVKGVPLSEAPDELFNQIIEAQQVMLETDYRQLPDTSQNPTYKTYASVSVNGKIVAQLDNHGWVITSNAMAGSFTQAVNKADSKAGVESGPLLAQARAEEIAASMKGVIVKASTAMTQSAYDAIPQPKATIDTEAMKNDPRFAQLELLRQTHAAFLAQQVAQESCEGEALQGLG